MSQDDETVSVEVIQIQIIHHFHSPNLEAFPVPNWPQEDESQLHARARKLSLGIPTVFDHGSNWLKL